MEIIGPIGAGLGWVWSIGTKWRQRDIRNKNSFANEQVVEQWRDNPKYKDCC